MNNPSTTPADATSPPEPTRDGKTDAGLAAEQIAGAARANEADPPLPVDRDRRESDVGPTADPSAGDVADGVLSPDSIGTVLGDDRAPGPQAASPDDGKTEDENADPVGPAP